MPLQLCQKSIHHLVSSPRKHYITIHLSLCSTGLNYKTWMMCLGSFTGQIREEYQNSETPWNVWKLLVFPLQSPLTWASVWCENLKWLLWSRQKISWKNLPVLFFFFLIFGHALWHMEPGSHRFPWPGFKPVPRCNGKQSLNHWTAGEVPKSSIPDLFCGKGNY